uniref:AB hydrolase-1 domain-containing protein n=2 Tax=Lotharella globosa TaxID=91324 RepID=A0A7S4DH30_9EUKA
MTAAERWDLWKRCIAHVPSVEGFSRGWFRYLEDDLRDSRLPEGGGRQMVAFADLRRSNVKHWIAWGLWGRKLQPGKHDDDAAGGGVDADELERYVQHLEKNLGSSLPSGRFPEGMNRDIEVLQFSLEPVRCHWKPFCVFAILELAWFGFALVLFAMGFSYRRKDDVAYWIREGRAAGQPKPPVVLLHGVGLGVLPYISMLGWIGKQEGWGRTWIAVESPEYPRYHATSLMSVPMDYARTLKNVLMAHGSAEAIFLGHSIGTVYLTWIVRNAPEIVRDVILVDPVCLLLHHSKVLWNFLYARPPALSMPEVVQRWVVLMDPNISYRLRRNFTWYQNILWMDEIPSRASVLVLLAEKDEYVPTSEVADYVSRYAAHRHNRTPEESKPSLHEVQRKDHSKVQIQWLQAGARHGDCVLNEDGIKIFKKAILEFLQR